MTVVVDDLEEARRFFGLLGFVERVAVVVSGAEMGRYMGIADWEADHVTLELEGRRPGPPGGAAAAVPPSGRGGGRRGGVAGPDRLQPRLLPGVRPRRDARAPGANGVAPRNEVMDFHDRRLVFLDGPGVVVELAEWTNGSAGQGGHLT